MGLISFLSYILKWHRFDRDVQSNLARIDSAEKEFDKYMYYSHIEHQDNVTALYHITNAINLNPTSKYYCSRGILRKSMENYHDAIEDFNQSIVIDNNSALSWYSRASAYYSIDKKSLAYNDWKRAEILGSVGATNALNEYFKDYNHEPSLGVLAQKNDWIELKTNEIKSFVFLDGVIKNTNINRVTYQILLDCFEWQFKRFKILLRDNYKCNDCNIVSDKLHVHHRYYLKDHLPWEIDDSALVALCRDCHYKRHQSEDIKVYIKNGNQLTLTSRNFMFCPRCSGTGYLPQFRHVENGICFLCHGEIPKTIFTKRLKMISNKKQTDEEQLNQLLNFMDSISLDYYSANIHNKIHFSSANNEDNDLPF